MFEGRLEGIYLAEHKRAVLQRVEEIVALAGQGIRGDRYCRQQGTFSKPGSPDREVTLIETETLEALPAEGPIKISASESRRNIATAGVPLNHLVGREFWVGDVRMRGTRLCEPCRYLDGLTQAGVMATLIHRAGLRAQILNDGVIRPGDTVKPA